jgi:hypothetical protein
VCPFASSFVECFRRHSAKVVSLPSVSAITLGKEALSVPRCAFFAECYVYDTRQSDTAEVVRVGATTIEAAALWCAVAMSERVKGEGEGPRGSVNVTFFAECS